jgi:starvation-inducible DNA-binding protein
MAKNSNHATMKMVTTSHDLPASTRQEMAALLNTQLADTFDLFSHTKQAHWNVKGMQFYHLHELYDELAAELLAFVDLIAERAVILGGSATGTARMAAANTRLDEFSAEAIGSQASVEALVNRYATLAESTRKAIDTADKAGDMDTADLFTEVSRGLDKSLWFLEAHLQEK